MKMKLISELNQIQSKYDAFFIDLWGVIHNGVKLHYDAINVLENLDKLGKRYVLMSNAPRPSSDVENFLLNLGMNKIFVRNIFTSGQAALKSLEKNIYGKYFYHLGPPRDAGLFDKFKKNKKKIEEADFILCTGFLDEEESLEYYKKLLKKYVRLKMICTNPDLVVHRGSKKEYCAGTLAKLFEDLGGETIYFGKPYPEIYKFCLTKGEKVLVIGDNIRTDIKGANNMELDSLCITGGVHNSEFKKTNPLNYDKILERYGVTSNYYQERLIW